MEVRVELTLTVAVGAGLLGIVSAITCTLLIALAPESARRLLRAYAVSLAGQARFRRWIEMEVDELLDGFFMMIAEERAHGRARLTAALSALCSFAPDLSPWKIRKKLRIDDRLAAESARSRAQRVDSSMNLGARVIRLPNGRRVFMSGNRWQVLDGNYRLDAADILFALRQAESSDRLVIDVKDFRGDAKSALHQMRMYISEDREESR